MPYLTTNGVKIAYQQFGAGPDLVMIHGLATNRAFWYLRLARVLQRRFRVTLYDLRGHGKSGMPNSGYTPRAMAQDLGCLLDEFEIDQAVLVGHSYGGMVALKYAALAPERVSHLVVADTWIPSVQPRQTLGDSKHLTPFEQKLMLRSGIDWKNETRIGLRFLEELAKPEHRELRMRSKGFVPFGGPHGNQREASRWLKLLEETSAREDLSAPREPTRLDLEDLRKHTLLVYGERSRCLPSCRALQKIMTHCETIVVPEAGHFHPVSRPGFFLSSLTGFFQRTGALPERRRRGHRGLPRYAAN